MDCKLAAISSLEGISEGMVVLIVLATISVIVNVVLCTRERCARTRRLQHIPYMPTSLAQLQADEQELFDADDADVYS
eukprot:m.146382 g.146382  ORF g.146382 m.146382 type:complete len:78 (-) comp10091_c0_seq1:17-250(-)